MKRRVWVVLGFEAFICLLFCIFGQLFNDTFSSVFAFPFEQLGAELRWLSLTGAAGNAAAVGLYCVLGGVPLVYLLLRVIKGRARWEDSLLALLSLLLFIVIYLMVNPGYIAKHFGSAEIVDMGKAVLGFVLYSVIFGYLILRMLRYFKGSSLYPIQKLLQGLFMFICAMLVFDIFGAGFAGLLAAFENLKAGNTMPGQNLTLSNVFLVLQYFVKILPSALGIVVISSGLDLLGALGDDPYGEAVAAFAQKTGEICRKSVIAIILSQIVVNVLQLMLGSAVYSGSYTLSIPVYSIAFMLGIILLTTYFKQAAELKKDNDMFI